MDRSTFVNTIITGAIASIIAGCVLNEILTKETGTKDDEISRQSNIPQKKVNEFKDKTQNLKKVDKSSSEALAPLVGTLKDYRDGIKYKIIEIGNQFWMAENLRTEINAECYDFEQYYCNTYGKLYRPWESAKEKICPFGWHIPSKKEWEELFSYLGGYYSDYNSNEEVIGNPLVAYNKSIQSDGLNLIFGGIHWGLPYPCDRVDKNGESYIDCISENLGKIGYYLTSSEAVANLYYAISIDKQKQKVSIIHVDVEDGISCRCIKD